MENIATEIAKKISSNNKICLTVITSLNNAENKQQAHFKFKILNILTKQYFRDIKNILSYIHKLNIHTILVTNSAYSFIGWLTHKPVYVRTAANDFLRPWIGPKLPFWEYIYYHRFKYWFPFKFWYNDIGKVKFRKFFAIRGLKRAKIIFANSKWTKNQLINVGINPKKIICITGGVDQNIFINKNKEKCRQEIHLSTDKIILVTLSHFVKVKGIDNAIHKISKLVKSNPIFEYHIYGKGPEKDNLNKIIKKLHCENHIFIHDEVEHKKIPYVINSADILLQLSIPAWDRQTNSHHIESMGLILCESNACGTPVIASNLGGIPSVITNGSNGILVDPFDSDEVIVNINKIIENKRFRSQLIANGYKRVEEEFKLESVVNKITRHIIE